MSEVACCFNSVDNFELGRALSGMNTSRYDQALRKQFRDPRAYLAQAGNLSMGLCRVFGWWLTTMMTCALGASLLALVTFKGWLVFNDLGSLFFITGLFSAVHCYANDYGKFRNVFRARALKELHELEVSAERH